MSGGVEWFTAHRSVLIFPSVPCRKHWDVTRQIKSLAQLIRSAQNGWGGDLWLLCEGLWRGGDRRWCDLMSPVWHGFIQNLGIPLEVKRGGKDVTSVTWMEFWIVSIFFALMSAKTLFLNLTFNCPQRKNEIYQHCCIHLSILEEQRVILGCKKSLKEITFAGSAALLLIEVNVLNCCRSQCSCITYNWIPDSCNAWNFNQFLQGQQNELGILFQRL